MLSTCKTEAAVGAAARTALGTDSGAAVETAVPAAVGTAVLTASGTAVPTAILTASETAVERERGLKMNTEKSVGFWLGFWPPWERGRCVQKPT